MLLFVKKWISSLYHVLLVTLVMLDMVQHLIHQMEHFTCKALSGSNIVTNYVGYAGYALETDAYSSYTLSKHLHNKLPVQQKAMVQLLAFQFQMDRNM